MDEKAKEDGHVGEKAPEIDPKKGRKLLMSCMNGALFSSGYVD